MPSILRTFRVTLLVLAVPFLAVAEDTAPIVTPPPAAVETPQTGPAVTAGENRPASPAAVAQTARIGYVDMARMAEETHAAKELQAKLKQRKDKLQGRIDAKRKQLDKLRASLEAKLATLAPSQREAKYREFQKKVEEFQKMAREGEEELLKLQESGTTDLFGEIEQAAAAYGKANDFAVIVVKRELLYLGNGVDARDVTEALVKSMNGAREKK